MSRNNTPADDLLPWHDGNAGERLVRPGDPVGARQWLAQAVNDDARAAALRLRAQALGDGVDFSRLDDHHTLEHLEASLTQGRLFVGASARPTLRNLSVMASPAPAPAPAPAAAPPRAAPAEPPPPAAETTFGRDVDVDVMVAALQQAARDGVPFCEECVRPAAETGAEA